MLKIVNDQLNATLRKFYQNFRLINNMIHQVWHVTITLMVVIKFWLGVKLIDALVLLNNISM